MRREFILSALPGQAPRLRQELASGSGRVRQLKHRVAQDDLRQMAPHDGHGQHQQLNALDNRPGQLLLL
ncbi:hypothetical protein SDC9_83456 [bioreactor metagenome]|uniref:Uncharacterized protein n=1 Tax=bioreactor metagenome TaxID=1076179 RepID=A0A644Z7T2_9ZZZZ